MRSLALLALLCCGLAPAAEYYVAPGGNDANPGTLARPCRTLAKAAALLQPGDTCYLRAGTYREALAPGKSGAEGKPLVFAAYRGEQVTLTGTELLAGAWEVYRGSIYRLATPLRFTQLLADGKLLPEARWPNSPPGDLMGYARAAAGAGTDKTTLADPALPPGDWNGATVLLWPGDRWTSATRRVAGYQPGKSFRFDEDFSRSQADPYHTHDPYSPRAGNPYVLSGSLAGLDAPGEWFLDAAAGVVYLWLPAGDAPAGHRLEVRQRDYAVDLSRQAFIQLRGLDLSAGAANLTEARDCLLEDCRLRYPQHTPYWGKQGGRSPLNVVSGQRNTLRRCLIAYCSATGLRVTGEANTLDNCIIHDVDYTGTGQGGLNLNNSVGAIVRHCTVCRTGRDAIAHHKATHQRLEYNDVYLANMLNNDAGAMYCWGTDSDGGVIAYNWVHDNLGDATCGIYLDNFCKRFLVHHNVVWNCTGSGLRLNSDAIGHTVANNTVAAVAQPFGTFTYAAYKPTMEGTRIINNLVNAPLRPTDPGQFVQGQLGPVLSHNGPAALDRDGRPVAGSAAVDAGEVLAGITDGYQGQAPDLGAYEYGGERWTAGADWRDPEAPAPPARDLTYTPRGPVTAATMLREGLLLWLDAADAESLDLGADGAVVGWRDKSGQGLVARPADRAHPVRLVTGALGGLPAVRGDGTGCLRVEMPPREPGPLTIVLVSQGLEAGGPPWQRLAAASTTAGEEWVPPNWILMRAGGATPQAYQPRVFSLELRQGGVLDRLTLLGASASPTQCLKGDLAELLIFGRVLRFDEQMAIEQYLQSKWGLAQ